MLFHSSIRASSWTRHFRWESDRRSIAGRTHLRRATVAALDMNAPYRKEARHLWFETGWLPKGRAESMARNLMEIPSLQIRI